MLTFPLFFSKNCICEKNVLSLHTFLQSKRNMIKHDGIIIALNEDGTALVRIVQTSACSACKAKAMCASAESAEKEMTAVLLGENGKQFYTILPCWRYRGSDGAAEDGMESRGVGILAAILCDVGSDVCRQWAVGNRRWSDRATRR